MTLSQPTHHRSDTQHSCWFMARNAGTRHTFVDSQSLTPRMLPSTVQLATSFLRPHQRLAANRSPFPRHADLLHSHVAAKSP
jgi:hypothetical protein